MSEMIIKIDEMLEISRQMINKDYSKGYHILNEALELAEKHTYSEGLAWGTLRKGSYLLRKEDKPLAITYYYKALNKMEENVDYQGMCRCHYSLATTFAILTQYDYALNHFLKALELAGEYDEGYYSKILNNLSNVYRYLKQFDEALLIGKRTVEYMKEKNDPRLFMPYTSLGQVCLEQGDYKQALNYADKSLKYLDLNDEGSYRCTANIIVAGAYNGLKHYDEALIVFNRALKILEDISDDHNKPYIHRKIGDLYLVKKEYNYAFKHVQIAMTEAIKQHNTLEEAEILFVYARLYEALENYKKAYESYKRANLIIEKSRSKQLHERYQALIVEHPEMLSDDKKTASKKTNENSLSYTLKELKSGYSFLKKIEKGELTDAFVEAVVDTIDLRDTTTSGHSKRLADYATKMMNAINEDMLEYPEIYFTEQEIKVMYYAALLHDIGKLGVPEKILLKNCRISKDSLHQITTQVKYCSSILNIKLEKNTITDIEKNILKALPDAVVLISKIAVAHDISEEEKNKLKEIFSYVIVDELGVENRIINLKSYEQLVAYRGNLTETEWGVMKNHAQDTMKFLKKIPWLEGLEMVPELAGGHHEKLDGSGYPYGLKSSFITLPMRILGVVDIFEALTAKDRPYKKTFTVEQALDILKKEANEGKIDLKVVNFFESHKLCYLFFDER